MQLSPNKLCSRWYRGHGCNPWAVSLNTARFLFSTDRSPEKSAAKLNEYKFTTCLIEIMAKFTMYALTYYWKHQILGRTNMHSCVFCTWNLHSPFSSAKCLLYLACLSNLPRTGFVLWIFSTIWTGILGHSRIRGHLGFGIFKKLTFYLTIFCYIFINNGY